MGISRNQDGQHQTETARGASEKLARGQMLALTRTLDAMVKETAPNRMLDHVLRAIAEQLEADSMGIWYQDETDGLLSLEFSCDGLQTHNGQKRSYSTTEFAVLVQESPLWQEIARTGQPSVWLDVTQEAPLPFQEYLAPEGIETVLGVPLFVVGQVPGMLGIRFRDKRSFSGDKIELAQALAHQATLAIRFMRMAEHNRLASVVAERSRMARDMHDTLAQSFTGVIVQLEAAEDALQKGVTQDVERHIQRAGEVARSGLQEARRSALALRPQALEDNGFKAALENLFKTMTLNTTLNAKIVFQGQPRPLQLGWDEHLLRIIQEILTNVLRHSRATSLKAEFVFEPDKITIEVSDDGVGFDASAVHGGFGLRGMKQRVSEMGGNLTIKSVYGQGTTVLIQLPLLTSAGGDSNEYSI